MTEPGARDLLQSGRRERFQPPVWLQRVAIGLAAFFVLLQSMSIQSAASKAALAAESPIKFLGLLEPDRPAYRPGDTLRLTYTRQTTEPDFLVLMVESFENIETGEVFPGPLLGRSAGGMGTLTTRSVRVLPRELPQGHYVLEGWALPQTSRRSLPSRYTSEPFEVKR